MSWLQAGAVASATRTRERQIRNGAAEKLLKLREALNWLPELGDPKPVLLTQCEQTLKQEHPHLRLITIWTCVEEAKGVSRNEAQSSFNATVWNAKASDGLAKAGPVIRFRSDRDAFEAFALQKRQEWLADAVASLVVAASAAPSPIPVALAVGPVPFPSEASPNQFVPLVALAEAARPDAEHSLIRNYIATALAPKNSGPMMSFEEFISAVKARPPKNSPGLVECKLPDEKVLGAAEKALLTLNLHRAQYEMWCSASGDAPVRDRAEEELSLAMFDARRWQEEMEKFEAHVELTCGGDAPVVTRAIVLESRQQWLAKVSTLAGAIAKVRTNKYKILFLEFKFRSASVAPCIAQPSSNDFLSTNALKFNERPSYAPFPRV